MSLRFRKSIRVAPGLKVNFTKTGIGMSVGGRGARYSVHSSGRHTASVGLPGTGLSFVSTSSHKNARGTRRRATSTLYQTHYNAPPRPAKPGLFAPKGEKLLYAAIKADLDSSLLAQVEAIPHFTRTAQLFNALRLTKEEDKSASIQILQSLHDEGYHPENDKLVIKYANATKLTVGSLPGINLVLTLAYDDMTIFLAELYRQQDKFKEASALLQSAPKGFNRAIFICRLCDSAEKYAPILSVTNGLTNDSENSMLLLIYRGVALGKTGHMDASIATFKEALRYPSRDLDLRMLGWRERGRMYLEAGKKSLAKKDLEKVFAENSEYPEIVELLGRVNS
jgi:tetratricopeptide (TPR) repeat protein